MSSIRRQLSVELGLVLCALWGGGALALYLSMRTGLVSEFDRGLEASAQALVAATSEEESGIEVDFVPEAMPGFTRDRRPDYFQMWLPDGSPGARSPSLGDAVLPQRAGSLEAPHLSNLTLPDGSYGRAIGLRFVPRIDEELVASRPPTPPRPAVTLVVARHRDELDRRLGFLATALLLVGGGTALATALLAPLLVRRGLRPLARLAAHTASIDATALDLRFGTRDMPDELLPICQRLNELLTRLQASFERERRFSADVAHELRTPIAELRSASEIALKWPDDRAASARALQDAVEIAVQMEAITAGLLALARCEAGLEPLARASVGVAALIEESWGPLADRARQKGLTTSWAVPADLACEADPSLLRLALANLLSNAVEYSPPGGPVRCEAAATGDRWQLTLSNRAYDLTPEDVPHLFERFWRKDPARTGARSGLGLALVKAFADAMGMEVEAELRADSTLGITVRGRRPEERKPDAQPAPAVASAGARP